LVETGRTRSFKVRADHVVCLTDRTNEKAAAGDHPGVKRSNVQQKDKHGMSLGGGGRIRETQKVSRIG